VPPHAVLHVCWGLALGSHAGICQPQHPTPNTIHAHARTHTPTTHHHHRPNDTIATYNLNVIKPHSVVMVAIHQDGVPSFANAVPDFVSFSKVFTSSFAMGDIGGGHTVVIQVRAAYKMLAHRPSVLGTPRSVSPHPTVKGRTMLTVMSGARPLIRTLACRVLAPFQVYDTGADLGRHGDHLTPWIHSGAKHSGKINTGCRVTFWIPLACLHVRPMGLHRTCRQANAIESTAAHEFIVVDGFLAATLYTGASPACVEWLTTTPLTNYAFGGLGPQALAAMEPYVNTNCNINPGCACFPWLRRAFLHARPMGVASHVQLRLRDRIDRHQPKFDRHPWVNCPPLTFKTFTRPLLPRASCLLASCLVPLGLLPLGPLAPLGASWQVRQPGQLQPGVPDSHRRT